MVLFYFINTGLNSANRKKLDLFAIKVIASLECIVENKNFMNNKNNCLKKRKIEQMRSWTTSESKKMNKDLKLTERRSKIFELRIRFSFEEIYEICEFNKFLDCIMAKVYEAHYSCFCCLELLQVFQLILFHCTLK